MAFGSILDLVGIASKAADNTDISSLANDLKNTQSISERARKSIFVYPVLFSSGMSDLDLDMDVTKFLEIQYGIFTMLTVGMNPTVEDGSIHSYLNSISAEDVDGISLTMKSYDPRQVKTWYDMFSEENKDFFEEYKYTTGTEAAKFSSDADDDDKSDNKNSKGKNFEYLDFDNEADINGKVDFKKIFFCI